MPPLPPPVRKRSVWFTAYLLTWLLIPHVLLAKKRPTATLAWIWGIIAVPFIGPLTYWLLGADRIQRKRLRKARKLGLLEHPAHSSIERQTREITPAKNELIQTLSQVNQIPSTTAARVDLLIDATEFYPSLLEAIRGAEHHVHIEFFIWRDDGCGREFVEELASVAKRGVVVRLLLDQIGCWGVSRSFFKPLIEAGGRFSWFYSLPLWRHSRFMNLRNHRKLQIIDGRIAFVGGMNMGGEHLGKGNYPWRDAQLRVEGGVVRHLQELFAEDWFFATDERIAGAGYYLHTGPDEEHLVQIISGGPDRPREPIAKSILALLNGARRRVWLTTGYFVPNQLFLTALQLCAARGVDVRLLVSEKTDHPYLLQVGRSYYEDLLEWGVRVWEYNEGINHKKAMLLDDEWLMIGSANSDNRSMRLNFELNLLAHAPQQAHRLERLLEREFAMSREILLEEVQARSLAHRLIEAALRPLAPML